MLPVMSGRTVEGSASSGFRTSAGSGKPVAGFDGFLHRAMGRRSASATEMASGMEGQAEDPKLSLGSVLERMRVQWRMFSQEGRQDVPVEGAALETLRQLVSGNGREEGTGASLLAVLEGAERENLSLGRLLDKLQTLAGELDAEQQEEKDVDTASLSMGAFPFVYTLLQDMGIPRERMETLMDRSMAEGQGLQLERLGGEMARLRQDLTEGRLLPEAQGMSRDAALRTLDGLLEGIRALGGGGESPGISLDTARILERAVLSAMAGKDFRDVLAEKSLEFRLPDQEMGAQFLRDMQPGGQPVGVTESPKVLERGVPGKALRAGGQREGETLWDKRQAVRGESREAEKIRSLQGNPESFSKIQDSPAVDEAGILPELQHRLHANGTESLPEAPHSFDENGEATFPTVRHFLEADGEIPDVERGFSVPTRMVTGLRQHFLSEDLAAVLSQGGGGGVSAIRLDGLETENMEDLPLTASVLKNVRSYASLGGSPEKGDAEVPLRTESLADDGADEGRSFETPLVMTGKGGLREPRIARGMEDTIPNPEAFDVWSAGVPQAPSEGGGEIFPDTAADSPVEAVEHASLKGTLLGGEDFRLLHPKNPHRQEGISREPGSGAMGEGENFSLLSGLEEKFLHGESSGNPQESFSEKWMSFSPVVEKKEREGELQSPGVSVLQGFRASEGGMARTADAPPPPPAYVMDQVSRRMAQAVQEGQNEVSFQLKPENMGRLHLRIESLAGGVNIRILAERKGTHEMLTLQAAELKAQMQEQGIRVERIEVSVAADFDTALFREKERERESRRSRHRDEGSISRTSGMERMASGMPVRVSRGRASGLDLMA